VLILHRADTPAAQQPMLDLQIDLRILERWLLVQASNADPESERQVQAYLRSYQMGVASAQMQDLLKLTPNRAMTHTQSDAMVRLHQITYNLPDVKTPKEKGQDDKDPLTIDQVCHDTGEAMLNIASAQPVDAKTVPLMRPKAVLRPRPMAATRISRMTLRAPWTS